MSSLHILQAYSYIQIQLSCGLAVMDPKSKYLLYSKASSVGLSLAAGSCKLLEASNLLGCCFPLLIICEYLLQIPLFSSSLLRLLPLFPALGHLLCPWTWVFLLQWFSPVSSLWGHGVQSLCCPPFTMSWAGFLPTLRPVQIFQEGEIWVKWFSMEQASPWCPWVRNPGEWEPRASF